jgi:putative membrane protein
LVTGTPRPIIARLTRPAAVDTVLRLVVKPVPAVAIVTVVAVGTLTTGVVSLAAHSDLARVVIQIVVLLSGFVLWAPVLTELPGRQPLSAIGRGGYLIVQSIVPSFLSVVWIFARRPLYASYDHHARVLGMSPVLDQQLAGFLAKLSTIAVLWTVAFTLMTRSQVTAGTDEDAEPLIWSDVEREIERADRRDQRARRPHLPTPPEAPPVAPPT